MADTSYPLGGQGVYRAQGGRELVIGTSGTLTIEGAGAVNVTGVLTVLSSGELNVDSGGAITVDDGGHFTMPVTVQATSTGTITNYGVTTFGTTTANTYTLAVPTRAGLRKILACTIHGATTITDTINTNSTAVTILSTSGQAAGGLLTRMLFTNAGQRVELVSLSTSQWLLVSNTNTVAISTNA